MGDKHEDALKHEDFHKEGACVCRHSAGDDSPCNYAWNGYNVTKDSRASKYNASQPGKPGRFDPNLIRTAKQESRKVKAKTVWSPFVPSATRPFDPTMWDIGAHDNFKPGGGFHRPYLHNWHHMIANRMLFNLLFSQTRGYELLYVLMKGKYNINGPRNIVLLPMQEGVGKIINWPIHPSNHFEFDAYAKKQLGWLYQILNQILTDKTAHDVSEDKASKVAEELDSISDQLFSILENMPGGTHINQVEHFIPSTPNTHTS